MYNWSAWARSRVIKVQASLQSRATFDLTAKCRRLHSPCGTPTLYLGARGRSVHAQHQGDSQHAFVADEANFETGVAVYRSDQRDEALGGKKDVANALARLAEHISNEQLDLLAAREQMFAISAG